MPLLSPRVAPFRLFATVRPASSGAPAVAGTVQRASGWDDMLDEQRLAQGDQHGEAPPPTLSGTSLFFDFDGTLIDLAPTPDAVVVEAELIVALERLASKVPGRLAIVSGRSLDVLDRLIGSFATRIMVAGSHGAERRSPDGTLWVGVRPDGLDAAAHELRRFAEEHGLLYEPKSLGAAVHYRHQAQAAAAVQAAAQAIAQRHGGLVIQQGKMMVELRSAGHKGEAVEALLATPAMAGTRPLFFGDDVTDEDGFETAARLGGAGVLIGEPRATAAHYRLPGVAAMRDWIVRAAA